MTVLAVDWSGRRSGEQRFLWVAEAADGVLVRLEAGRTRAALVEHLLARAESGRPPLNDMPSNTFSNAEKPGSRLNV